MAMKEKIHFASIDIEDKMTWEEEGEEKAENNACHILPWFMWATLQMKQFDVNLLDMENIEWQFPGQGLQIWHPLRQQIHQYLDKIIWCQASVAFLRISPNTTRGFREI